MAQLRERIARLPRDPLWLAFIALALLAAEVIAAAVVPVYGYDRWDNFEYYTPMIAAAHRTLLSGQLPVWNPHQHLGESLLGNPQMGTFYPPYTLAYLGVTLLGLPIEQLCTLISVAHAIAGALGCFVLLRHLGTRGSLAAVAALGMASGGYVRSAAAVWVFVGPTFAWLPWTLWGAACLLEGSRRARHGLVFAAGLAAQAYLGQPQIWVYVWLCIALCCLGLWLVQPAPMPERWRRAGWLSVNALAAICLGLLTMLPVFIASRSTSRKGAVRFGDFIFMSASGESLSGLLLPVYRALNGFFLEEPCSFALHQGAWLLPALVLGLASWVAAERGRGEARLLARRALVFSLVGGVLLVFALGDSTPIYPLTYAVPVWSSFRWPHKFLMLALPCLGIAGGLGLELAARATLAMRSRVGVALAFTAGALLLATRSGWAPVASEPLGMCGLAAAAVALLAAPFVSARAGRVTLLAAALASAPVSVALAQLYTPNAIEHPHQLAVVDADWVDGYRVLPVHRDRSRSEPTERLMFTSATLLGVDSVTGCTTTMAPDWYTAWLKSDFRGLLPDATYRELLPSHFLRSLNVRYVVAPAHDPVVEGWLRAGGLALSRRSGSVAHYELPDALPRAYFASEVHRFTPRAFREGLWHNRADVRAAYVEGGTGDERAGPGQVLHADFSRADRPALDVESADGGFLVISMSHAPEWHAVVDGVEREVLRTNAMMQGLAVPPGRHHVELRYENAAFRWGTRSAALGIVLLVLATLLRRRGAAVPVAG